MADQILVNSKFTQGVFAETFQTLNKKHCIVPEVLYPSINLGKYDVVFDVKEEEQKLRDKLIGGTRQGSEEEEDLVLSKGVSRILSIPAHMQVLLSINRFERKKTIEVGEQTSTQTHDR